MKKLLLLVTLLFPAVIFAADYQIDIIAEELNHPWSIDFLPEGGYLVCWVHSGADAHWGTAVGRNFQQDHAHVSYCVEQAASISARKHFRGRQRILATSVPD